MKTQRFKIKGVVRRTIQTPGGEKPILAPVEGHVIANFAVQIGDEIRPQGSKEKITIREIEPVPGGPAMGDWLVWKSEPRRKAA